MDVVRPSLDSTECGTPRSITVDRTLCRRRPSGLTYGKERITHLNSQCCVVTSSAQNLWWNAAGCSTENALAGPSCTIAIDRYAGVAAQPAPMDRHRSAYYVRLMVTDRPGVLPEITAVFRDHHVSLEAVVQRARDPHGPVPLSMPTARILSL